MALSGGCLCGAVRYETDAEPYGAGLCHCVTCRKASGAPMTAWFSVKAEDLRLTGELRKHRSSDHAVRSFCPGCGTQLLFDDARYPDEVDVSIASLDDPDPVRPEKHIWTRSQLNWVRLADGLPSFAERSA
jgi:hypothetical protein